MSYQNIDVETFKEKIANQPEAIIVDVRTPAELVEGEVPNHQMINFNAPSFLDDIQELDKDKTYLLYCRSGGRSERAAQMMSQMGFKDVYNLLGGIMAWNAAQSS